MSRINEVDAECPYIDRGGNHLGHCNSCGEEIRQFDDCCADGEWMPYDDDKCEDI